MAQYHKDLAARSARAQARLEKAQSAFSEQLSYVKSRGAKSLLEGAVNSFARKNKTGKLLQKILGLNKSTPSGEATANQRGHSYQSIVGNGSAARAEDSSGGVVSRLLGPGSETPSGSGSAKGGLKGKRPLLNASGLREGIKIVKPIAVAVGIGLVRKYLRSKFRIARLFL